MHALTFVLIAERSILPLKGISVSGLELIIDLAAVGLWLVEVHLPSSFRGVQGSDITGASLSSSQFCFLRGWPCPTFKRILLSTLLNSPGPYTYSSKVNGLCPKSQEDLALVTCPFSNQALSPGGWLALIGQF
jgi:hypothetical protein